MSSVLRRKLDQIASLSEDELSAIESAASRRIKIVEAHEDIVREGERAPDCNLILEGFAFRYKILPGGRRQILSYQIPGDFCDIQSFVLRVQDHGVGTITRCRVALISHSVVQDITEKYPRVARALWRETLVDAALYREWMASMGRRNAYQRIAHLLCELATRLEAVGLNQGDSYVLPITQAELADSLGLSIVHVNRTLQQLRTERLISLRSGRLLIHDRTKLETAGEFDPAYLQLRESAA
jgi:CRP-like cAMP-binding protein